LPLQAVLLTATVMAYSTFSMLGNDQPLNWLQSRLGLIIEILRQVAEGNPD
jgi:hypothetical protein